MTDRVHDALDGALPHRDLTPAERAELERLQSAAEAVAGHLAREAVPDLTASVMRELEGRARTAADPRGGADPGSTGEAGPRSAGWRAALWQPREIRVRPVWGLLAAAALAGLVLLPRGGEMPASPAIDAEPLTVFVQFRLHAPEASEVRLAGSFTSWEPRYLLDDAGEGVWTLLVPMEPGIHDYAFVIDGGTWVPDPAAPRVDDGFGGENSRLALLPPNGGRES